jgi:hypothetical protein
MVPGHVGFDANFLVELMAAALPEINTLALMIPSIKWLDGYLLPFRNGSNLRNR